MTGAQGYKPKQAGHRDKQRMVTPPWSEIEAASPEFVRSVLSPAVELNFLSVFVFIKTHNGFNSSYFSVYKINSQFIG